RRVHGRRHAARPVADRLGDCRGPLLRARRRSVLDGSIRPVSASPLSRLDWGNLHQTSPSFPRKLASSRVAWRLRPCRAEGKRIRSEMKIREIEMKIREIRWTFRRRYLVAKWIQVLAATPHVSGSSSFVQVTFF